MIIALLLLAHVSYGQKATFIRSGKIEFERKINNLVIWQQYQKEEQSSWIDDIVDRLKKSNDYIVSTKWDLYFDRTKTLFKANNDNPNMRRNFWDNSEEQKNQTYSDFSNNQVVKEKQVYESLFLLQDSVKQIRWKLTDETREIAGITCRRANAIIFDSVYIVAFYTDQIPTQGGPELFQGLPGMILGLAMPDYHITYFAKKIETIPSEKNKLEIPSKGKKYTTLELMSTLKELFKSRGSSAAYINRMLLIYQL